MTDAAALLGALQHGDSFFPSGGFAFSWGLETLHAEGAVTTADDVARFAEGQIRHRWAPCDRPALLAAHRADDDRATAIAVDAELEALALPAALRAGSRRAGCALLGVHTRLGTPGAAKYRALVMADDAPGHLAVAQGLVWRGAGIAEAEAAAISAYTLIVSIVGAAVRLGAVGHVDGQKILSHLRAPVVSLLAEPAPERPSAFTPAADIAMMRHEGRHVRLFAN